jgi:type VI secretion system protein
MREERLLIRLRTWEKEPARRGKEDPRRIIDSVSRHLHRILNTKQGNVPIGEDYGLPDLTDFLKTYPGSLMEIERGMRIAIQKYEPRLKAVRVTFFPQEDDLLSLQVLFNALINADGKINIRD